MHSRKAAARIRLAALVVCCLYSCADESSPEAGEGTAGGDARAAAIARGRQLYGRNGCAACHGSGGHGDGRIAHTLRPPPRDFRQPENFRHGYEIEQIAATIRDGVAYPNRVMPSYGHLPEVDLRSLAVYIRSLADGEGVSE
jgi:mono/diheme cytochrome c family protein